MKPCTLALVIALAVLLISGGLFLLVKSKESYGRTGVPNVPLNYRVPKHLKPMPGYISYNQESVNALCPSKPGEGRHCMSRWDCPGLGELCYNSAGFPVIEGQDQPQPESNYCTCSLQNPCMIEGIC
jgi:hypothetical protein